MNQACLILSNDNKAIHFSELIQARDPHIEIFFASHASPKSSLPKKRQIKLSLGKEVEQITAGIADQQLVAVINFSERYVPLHGEIVDKFNLPGPSYKSVMLCKDKAALHQLMLDNNLGHFRPQTKIVPFDTNFSNILNTKVPFVIKPHVGAKSRGVFIVRHKTNINIAVSYLRGYFDSSMVRISQGLKLVMIEEFIEGPQISSTCFVDASGKLHTLSYVDILAGKDIGQNHAQLVHRSTPSQHSKSILKDIEQLLQQLVDLTGIRSTFMHPEFILKHNRPYLIELNVRMGGFRSQLTKRAFGLDIESMAVEIAFGNCPNSNKLYEKSCTATEVWSDESGVLKKCQIEARPELSKVWTHVKVGDTYIAPPVNQQPLAHYYTTTDSNSLITAQEVFDSIHIEFES